MPSGPSWAWLLQHWSLIEADLHEVFGIDVADDALLAARTWPWLASRISALLSRPATFVPYKHGDSWRMTVVESTRIALAFHPPSFGD